MRKVLLLSALLVFALAPLALAQDAVKVDAKHYKVVLENNNVRVLRAHYGPHEKSVMHSHPATVAVFLADGKVRFTYPDGKSEEASAKAGDAQYRDAVTHLPENMSDKASDVVVVELKGKAAPAAAAKPAEKKAPMKEKKP